MNLKEECGWPIHYSEKELNIEASEYDQNKKSKPLFTCEFCYKSFGLKCNLKVHIQGIHTKEKLFGCEECGNRFVTSSQLKTHIRKHTGERPYSCKVCLKLFKSSSALLNHRKVHTGEKSLPCELCGKMLKDCYALIIHIRTHTGEKPYKCSLCGTSFARQHCLKLHQNVHTHERPFKCDICEKSFRRRSNLHVHKARHNRKTPLKVYKERKERQFTTHELEQTKEEQDQKRLRAKDKTTFKKEIGKEETHCVIGFPNLRKNETDADFDDEINYLDPVCTKGQVMDNVEIQHENKFATGEDTYAEAESFETEYYINIDFEPVTVNYEMDNYLKSEEILESQSDLEYFESMEFYKDV